MASWIHCWRNQWKPWNLPILSVSPSMMIASISVCLVIVDCLLLPIQTDYNTSSTWFSHCGPRGGGTGRRVQQTCHESGIILHDFNSGLNSVQDGAMVGQNLIAGHGRFLPAINQKWNLPISHVPGPSMDDNSRFHALFSGHIHQDMVITFNRLIQLELWLFNYHRCNDTTKLTNVNRFQKSAELETSHNMET